MAFFGVRLPDDLAARFDALASSRGGRSKLLRHILEAAVRGDGPALPEAGPAVRPRGRSAKVTIRLGDEDLRALDSACEGTGLRRTEWVVALLRTRLLDRPQLNRAEAEALLEIRRELRRIGVNLNQAVRALHVSGGAEADRRAAELAAFQQEVRSQLEGVRAALDGDRAYWAAGDKP